MAKEVTLWYDQEGDYLEVLFEKKPGYFCETDHEAVMEKVDEEGHVIGFSVLKVSALGGTGVHPLSVTLHDRAA